MLEALIKTDAGYNSDRFAIQRNSHGITYLKFRSSHSRATMGLVLEVRKAISSGQTLIDFDLQYSNSPVGNRCTVQSVNDALGSVTNERLPCFLNGLACLNPKNIQTGRKPEYPLKTGWR